MNVGRLRPRKISCIYSGFRLTKRNNHNGVAASEYTEEPEYPPIEDLSWKSKKRREKEAWHANVKNLPTVEQKMLELNMPKYYGYWSCHLSDKFHPVNGVDFVKYATRTHVERSLPEDYYDEVKKEAGEVATRITDDVESLIDLIFNCPVHRRGEQKDKTTENFFLGLHKIMIAALSPTVDHIKESMVDVNPRIEAFWFLGGLEPDKMLKNTRKNLKSTEDIENDPIDRPMQGLSSPTLGVRGDFGLPEVVALEHPLASSGSIPVANLDPRAYGYKFKHKPATITTAYWPGENKEHCRLWLHANGFLQRSCDILGAKHYDNFLQQKMTVASFSQAFAHAAYLGFGPVTELTYPIVQQSAISDGQKWNFSVYQLNTCALHSERAQENPVNNVLWLSDEKLLFEAVDDTGVKEFNSEVLVNLVAMYLRKGAERENATPYIAPYKYLAHHPASEEYREDFHKFLLHTLSGRPKHRLKPEMFLWEKIYKMDFKTRSFEAPRRFFESHVNKQDPGHRRLDDYTPSYVPKAIRKDKDRWIKHKPRVNTERLFKYDSSL